MDLDSKDLIEGSKKSDFQVAKSENKDNLSWERQPGEPRLSFHAFVIYRELPPLERKVGVLRKKIGRSEDIIRQWMKQWNWKSRLADYLLQKAEEDRLQAEFVKKEMNNRHADLSKRILEKVSVGIDNIDPTILSPQELAKLMETGIKNERLARGEATEINKGKIQHTGNVSVTNTNIVASKVVLDPEAASLACELLEKIQLGQRITDNRPSVDPDKIIEHKNE